MSKKIIHIGANKTGSTTLQRHLFSKSSHIAYLGEDCYNYIAIENILHSLVTDDDLFYRSDEVNQLFSSHIINNPDKIIVYSDEDITMSRVPSQCANRLFTLMPDSKILLVIRDQISVVTSWYTNHGAYLRDVPYRYWRQPVEIDEWFEYCFKFINYSPLSGFKYFQIIELYEKLFGIDNIHILYYEDLLENSHMFITDLCTILGLDVQEGEKHLVGRWERKTSRPYKLSEHWVIKLKEFYAEDNSLLSQKYFNGVNRYGVL